MPSRHPGRVPVKVYTVTLDPQTQAMFASIMRESDLGSTRAVRKCVRFYYEAKQRGRKT